jgi:hypothetical protein
MDKNFTEWITDPIFRNVYVCKCGDFQGHKIIYCHNCGTKFIRADKLSRLDVLRMKCDFRKPEWAIPYFCAIYQSTFKHLGFHPTMGDFKELLKIT